MSVYRSDLHAKAKGLRVSTHAWNVFTEEEKNFHLENKVVIVVNEKNKVCLELIALAISLPTLFSPPATVLVKNVDHWRSLLPALGVQLDIEFCIVPPANVKTLVLLDPVQISHETPYESLISFVQFDEEDLSVHYTLYTRSFPAPENSVDALTDVAVTVIIVEEPEDDSLDTSVTLFQNAAPVAPAKKAATERCDFSAILYLLKGPTLVTHIPPNPNERNIALFVVSGDPISPEMVAGYCADYSRVYKAHTLVGSKSTLSSNSIVMSTFDDLKLAYAALCKTFGLPPFVSSAPFIASKAPMTLRLLREKINPIAEAAKKIIVAYYRASYAEYGVSELLHETTSRLEAWYINHIVKHKSLAMEGSSSFASMASRMTVIDARKKEQLAAVLRPGDDVVLHECQLVKEWVLFAYITGLVSNELPDRTLQLQNPANLHLSTAQILGHYASTTYLARDEDAGIVAADDSLFTSNVIVGHWGDPIKVKGLLYSYCQQNRTFWAWSLAVSAELRPAIIEYAREKKLLYRIAPLQLPIFDRFVVFYFSI